MIFAEDGFSAPLSAIARRAGVGQGSLYRHFPDRMALAVAVFDDNVSDLEDVADRPDTTLSDLVDRITEQALGSTALIGLISAERDDHRADHLRTRVTALVTTTLVRDQTAGRIGDHVEPADVLLSIEMLTTLLSRTDAAEREDVARRARSIFRRSFARSTV